MKVYEYKNVLIDYDEDLFKKINLCEPKIFSPSTLKYDMITISKVKLQQNGKIRFYIKPSRGSFIIGCIKQRFEQEELFNLLKGIRSKYVGKNLMLSELRSITY